jgi:N-acetylglutamate synthase-like GNAT family acetyltransferase
MSQQALRIRRATVDDLDALKAIWLSMRLPAEQLESRLTEFQVVERDGEVVGAVGFQISRTAALLHSEGYSDFSVADPARQMFWERIQTLAANHGVFRLWTQENSPFWLRWGFQPADLEALARLPDGWKTSPEKWFTLELKNEAVIDAVMEKQFSSFHNSEKKQSDEALARAKTITNLVTVFFFLVGFAGIGLAVYLFLHLKSTGHGP